MRNGTLQTVLDEARIQARIDELALEIDACYGVEPVVMICVLKGAFMFFSDLVRRVHCCPVLDFIGLSSYGNNTCTNGRITVTKDVSLHLAGRHVLVVEDIVDSGHSMRFLLEDLQRRDPLSVRVAALIDKGGRREVPVHVDFAGFRIDDGFLVGYGLDYAEQYRELPALYTLQLD